MSTTNANLQKALGPEGQKKAEEIKTKLEEGLKQAASQAEKLTKAIEPEATSKFFLDLKRYSCVKFLHNFSFISSMTYTDLYVLEKFRYFEKPATVTHYLVIVIELINAFNITFLNLKNNLFLFRLPEIKNEVQDVAHNFLEQLAKLTQQVADLNKPDAAKKPTV